MARARNIKPGFFANEELVELPFVTRLLFIGLWTVADRAGRLEDRPKRIKMAVFPADDVDVDACLDELQASGFLLRYEVDGNRYIQILAFDKHQHPHKDEKQSTIPAPCEHHADTVQDKSEPDANPADSLILRLSDSPKKDIAPPAPPRAAKSKRSPKKPMPDGFGISERVRKWAKEKGHGHLERHLENFISACRKHGYVYADWDEAFMCAVREDWAKLGDLKLAPVVKSVDEQVPSLANLPKKSGTPEAEAMRLAALAGLRRGSG